MPQPVKKGVRVTKKKSTRRKLSKTDYIKKQIAKSQKPHPKYGTSKLEDKFAKEFLDKLGVSYIRQFEAKDIKRFYDFAIKTQYGHVILLEVDGDYYHSFNLLHEEKNPMQKHNEWVDNVKNEWARSRGYQLIRIWEHDINKNPTKVMKMLKEALGKVEKDDNKTKRH